MKTKRKSVQFEIPLDVHAILLIFDRYEHCSKDIDKNQRLQKAKIVLSRYVYGYDPLT